MQVKSKVSKMILSTSLHTSLRAWLGDYRSIHAIILKNEHGPRPALGMIEYTYLIAFILALLEEIEQ